MKKIKIVVLISTMVFGFFLITSVRAEYGPPANMGPSAAQLEMMRRGAEMQKAGEAAQAAGEAKQKAAEAKGLERMKGAKKNFERGVNIIKTQVDKINKKGTETTPGMTESLSKLDGFLAKIDTTNDLEELQALYDGFGDLIDEAQSNLQIMSKLSKFPSVEKTANKQIADLSRQSAALDAKAKARGAEIATALADDFTVLNKNIEDLKTKLVALKEKVKTDPDTVFEEDVPNFFDQVRAVYENDIKGISASLSLKEAANKQLPQYVNSMTNRLKGILKNKKLNAVKLNELKILANQANNQLNKLKSLVKKAANFDAATEAIDELTNIGSNFDNKFDELTGQNNNSYEPKIDDTKDYQSPELEKIIKDTVTK